MLTPVVSQGVGEGAAPGLADGGGADEARGVVGWEPEEDLADGVFHKLRWGPRPRGAPGSAPPPAAARLGGRHHGAREVLDS